MEFSYEYNDQSYTLRLEPQSDGTYKAVVGDEEFTVSIQQSNGGFILSRTNGKPVQCYYANEGQQHFVALKGRVTQHYTLQPTVSSESRRKQTSAHGSGELTAQMPGQVIELLVAEGESVTHGQTLMVLEAMKMEIRVVAPMDGVVSMLTVTQGATVDRGQLLAQIKPKAEN